MVDEVERLAVVYKQNSHESAWLSVASDHLWTISTRASVAPVPAIPPNRRASMCGKTKLSTHLSTIDSNTLASIGVSDKGLISFSSESGGCFFGNGMTVAVFQSSGNIPSLSELLKIAVIGAANRSE